MSQSVPRDPLAIKNCKWQSHRTRLPETINLKFVLP